MSDQYADGGLCRRWALDARVTTYHRPRDRRGARGEVVLMNSVFMSGEHCCSLGRSRCRKAAREFLLQFLSFETQYIVIREHHFEPRHGRDSITRRRAVHGVASESPNVSAHLSSASNSARCPAFLGARPPAVWRRFRARMNQNHHRHWVIVLAIFAVAGLLLLLRVMLSHDRDQSPPKSVIIHGK